MTHRRISVLAATALAVLSTLLVADPAGADPADYHLTWYDTAEGTDQYGYTWRYQDVIDRISSSEVGLDNLGEITPASGTVELSCSSWLPSNATSWCFKPEDNWGDEWVPQGITTSYDGNGGSANKIFVTWYDGCSTDISDVDYQGCQGGPTEAQEAEKGVQVTIYTPGGGYRNVLLVEPFFNSSDNPSFHATHMHAGGVALYGNFLYVADTTHGMRVFDTRQIFDLNETKNSAHPYNASPTQVGRHSNQWYGHGYRWLWPAVGEWQFADRLTADGTNCLGAGNKMKFSSLSVDRATNNLVAAEYCPEPEPGENPPKGRVARWQLGSTTTASSGLATGWAWDGSTISLPKDHVQGVVSQGSTFYVNTSNGQSPGTLWKYDLVGSQLTNERSTPAAVGCEDLSFDTSGQKVWSLSEYYGRRAIYSVPASF